MVVDDDNLQVMDDSLSDLSLDVSRFRESGNGAYQGSKRERHAFIILVIIKHSPHGQQLKSKNKNPHGRVAAILLGLVVNVEEMVDAKCLVLTFFMGIVFSIHTRRTF